MHSTTLVLLEPPFEDLLARANALLRLHRLDEQNYKPGWRTDYWTTGEGSIRSEETLRTIAIDDEDLAGNVCFVRLLPPNAPIACIVTPDGAWHDCSDFGWRLRNNDAVNDEALKQWGAHVRGLCATWAHCVAIEFDTHS